MLTKENRSHAKTRSKVIHEDTHYWSICLFKVFSCYREPLTGRGTDIDSYKQINDEEKEEEEAKTVGELDVDDKIARPQSGQVDSRHLCTTLYK